jgi:hypothetical protein
MPTFAARKHTVKGLNWQEHTSCLGSESQAFQIQWPSYNFKWVRKSSLKTFGDAPNLPWHVA